MDGSIAQHPQALQWILSIIEAMHDQAIKNEIIIKVSNKTDTQFSVYMQSWSAQACWQ